MATLINSNIRSNLVEWVNVNKWYDFAQMWVGNVTNVRWFFDDDTHLAPTVDWTTLDIAKWYFFVKYTKDGNDAFLRCELLQNFSGSIASWNVFVYAEIDESLLISWSAESDGSDLFSIKVDSALPVSWTYLELYEIDSGSLVTDYRIKRTVEFKSVDAEEVNADTVNAGDVNVTGDVVLEGETEPSLKTRLDTIDEFVATATLSEYFGVAWEILTAWETLRLWVWSLAWSTYTQSSGWSYRSMKNHSDTRQVGQLFQLADGGVLSEISLRILGYWSPTWDISVSVYADQWDTLIATSTNTIDSSTLTTSAPSGDQCTFNFDEEKILEASTNYYVVINKTWSDDPSNYIRLAVDTSSSTWRHLYEINISWVWTERSWDTLKHTVTVNAISESISKLYKTNSRNASLTSFVWFARNNCALDEEVVVDFLITKNQSSLTPGTRYYLSDTLWGVSSTPWTIEKSVGVAVSETDIMLTL